MGFVTVIAGKVVKNCSPHRENRLNAESIKGGGERHGESRLELENVNDKCSKSMHLKRKLFTFCYNSLLT